LATPLGNLDLAKIDALPADVTKEKEHFMYLKRVMATPQKLLLPTVTITSEQNSDTKNGAWMVQSETQGLRLRAFVEALGEFQLQAGLGLEMYQQAIDKMLAAAADVQVNIMKWEEEEGFIIDWQEGEDVEHNAMMFSNMRFSNRGKKYLRASNIVKKKLDISTCTAKQIVQYYEELEGKNRIKTTFGKNKVSSPDDVKRTMTVYAFLQEHHLLELYAKLEYTPEQGLTPLGNWSFGRSFLAAVEGNGPLAKFVLRILEQILYPKESKLPAPVVARMVEKLSDKVLVSGPKLLACMKTIALQWKFMKCTAEFHAGKPIGSPENMESYITLLKKCLDFDEFLPLSQDQSGVVSSTSWPVQKFYDLFQRIVTQEVYGKFAEAEANYTTFEKKMKSEALKDIIEPAVKEWQDASVQYGPAGGRYQVEDAIEIDADRDQASSVLVTREDAENLAAEKERDGYLKAYVLTGDEAQDRQNMYDQYRLCQVKKPEAPWNMDTQGNSRVHVVDCSGLSEVNAAFIKGKRPYYEKQGFDQDIFMKGLKFFDWLEQPGVVPREENLGTLMVWDLSWHLRWSGSGSGGVG